MFDLIHCTKHKLSLVMDKTGTKPSLKKLYKSETIRHTIRDVLGPVFEETFECLMREGRMVKSLLTKEAKRYKIEIKVLFIEYGYELQTLEHLKIILDDLKIWDESDECNGDDEPPQSQSC